MKFLRREFLKLAGGVAAAATLPRRVAAADYPARPVRIVAGFTAGGGVDITARLIGQWLGEHLGQSFIIENRPGAGGNIGTEAVVNAAPDGYTLLIYHVGLSTAATLYRRLPYDTKSAFAAIGLVTAGLGVDLRVVSRVGARVTAAVTLSLLFLLIVSLCLVRFMAPA